MRIKTKTKTWESMRRTARRILPVAVLSLGATLGLVSGEVNAATTEAWGPKDRKTYTWEEPADHVVLNSITNNPSIGDERNFVRIRKAGTEDKFEDEVALEAGQEYEVMIWYHNNAHSKYNKKEYGGIGIAENARLRVEQPTAINGGTRLAIKGYVSADNADPQVVWDSAYITAEDKLILNYIQGSAVVNALPEAEVNGVHVVADALFGETGVYLGYWTDAWGLLPGCNQYSGYILYRFKADKPDFKISKMVSKENTGNFLKKITVKPGDVLDFKIDYENTGTVEQDNVIAYDHMPDGLEYVSGTSFFKPSVNEAGNFISDNLFNGGANLGYYAPGDSFYVTYKVEVKDDKTIFPCGETSVYNNASVATTDGTEYDKVEVVVVRDDSECDVPDIPEAGPTEIVLATVIVAGIGIGGAYYYASRRQLKKLTESTK